MPKRALAAFLWFAAAWFGYEIVWSVAGVPRLGGPVVAFLFGAFVTLDPLARFWPKSEPAPSAASEPTKLLA